MADAVQCILAIDDVKSSVQGSGKHFKNCLIGKMESTKAHIEDPAGYADELYSKIKNKCS
jgi:hypothetical protein